VPIAAFVEIVVVLFVAGNSPTPLLLFAFVFAFLFGLLLISYQLSLLILTIRSDFDAKKMPTSVHLWEQACKEPHRTFAIREKIVQGVTLFLYVTFSSPHKSRITLMFVGSISLLDIIAYCLKYEAHEGWKWNSNIGDTYGHPNTSKLWVAYEEKQKTSFHSLTSCILCFADILLFQLLEIHLNVSSLRLLCVKLFIDGFKHLSSRSGSLNAIYLQLANASKLLFSFIVKFHVLINPFRSAERELLRVHSKHLIALIPKSVNILEAIRELIVPDLLKLEQGLSFEFAPEHNRRCNFVGMHDTSHFALSYQRVYL
jgi:hypothetical protein